MKEPDKNRSYWRTTTSSATFPFSFLKPQRTNLPLPSVGEGWGEGAIPQVAFADSSPFLLAQATVQPSADDLAETPDVQFTDAIRAKAQELGGKPLKIYEWVRNNIEYAPTYGSIQGADQCLQSKICNDMDTASLLIALLRVSGVYSHYEYSTIEIPIEQAMNWVGGVTDPKMVGTILATNGIPAKMLVSGGTYKAVQLEHVYVSAFIDYIPSRGAVHKQGDTWIPLDASYKQYEYKRGMDLYVAMGINGEKYLQDYITDTSSLAIPMELQAALPGYIISPYQYYSKRLFNYLDANFPDATYQDIFGSDTIETSKAIVKKEYSYLLGTLPYSVTMQGTQYSAIPDSLRHKVNFVIDGTAASGVSLSYTTSLPETAGNRITLSYVPATSADESLLARYGALLDVPPYLINVKPLLKVNGVTAATGNPVGLGQEQTFDMTFTIPNIGAEFITNTVTAGDYSAIAILSQKVPISLAGDKMAVLINSIGSSDHDDLFGQMLYNVGVSYFHHLNDEEELYAKNFQMIVVKGLSEAMTTSHAVTNSLFGVPYNIMEGGIGIDVDKNEYSPFPYDSNQNRARDFMIISGLGSSAWESMILQSFFDIPSVSATSLLVSATQHNITIYNIDNTNVDSSLSEIQVASEVKNDIKNAVNAGKKVFISKTNVQYNDWDGVGYIVLDPVKGTAGYMISGGSAGSLTSMRAKASVIEKSIGTIYRTLVVMYAASKIGTFYDFGCVQGGLDCSGLTYRAYQFVGAKKFPRGVENQYNYVSQRDGFTTNPLMGDIVFFHGTYDSNKDNVVNADDKSHAGIYLNSGSYIAAQKSRGTSAYAFEHDVMNSSWAIQHFDAFGIVVP